MLNVVARIQRKNKRNHLALKKKILDVLVHVNTPDLERKVNQRKIEFKKKEKRNSLKKKRKKKDNFQKIKRKLKNWKNQKNKENYKPDLQRQECLNLKWMMMKKRKMS